jgi:cell shape-determining protein MreC
MFYKIDFIKDYEVLLNYIKKLKKENKPLPLLLWFYKIEGN